MLLDFANTEDYFGNFDFAFYIFCGGVFAFTRLTVCVTGAGAGVDSAWEQHKLEARKMLVNRADSPASSARGVGRFSSIRNSRLLAVGATNLANP
jgi:hypothetical protein